MMLDFLLTLWADGVNMNKHQYKQTNKDEKWIPKPQKQAGIIFKAQKPWSSNMQQDIHHTQFSLSDRRAERTFHWIEMDSKSFGSR